MRNRPWILALLFVGLGISFLFLPVKEWFQMAQGTIHSWGSWGPVLMMGTYALLTVAMIPGSAITLALGSLYGLAWGTFVVVVGANLGALGAFALGRSLMRQRVEAWTQDHPKFKALEKAVSKDGFKIVLLTRLSPAFPFTFLNYAFGLTRVKTSSYVAANLLGMLPGTFLYVYIGSLGGAALGQEHSALQWTLRIVGIAATLAVTVLVTRTARKALAEGSHGS